MTYRFVQLSDIHFGQENDGSLPEHNDVREQLIQDAAKMARDRGSATMVLVVGDIAYSGKQVEYARAGVWLDALTKAVGCEERAVRLVPGNHDCDRGEVDFMCRTVHEKIRAGTPKLAYGHLEELAKAKGQNPLLPKLQAYRDFAAGYESDFQSVGAPFWTKEFDLAEGVTLRLVGLNTVQVCDKHDVKGNMILGNTQYILPAEPHVIPMVLMHHPLHWLKDKEEAESYLYSRARVMMLGHEHIPRFSKISSADHERVDLSSGATNPKDIGAMYRHTYNWIELSLLDKAGDYVLKVEVFARAWVPDTTRFAADTPRMDGGQSVVFEIRCSQLRPRAAAKREPDADPPSVESPVGGIPCAAAAETVSEGGAVMMASDEDVAQLRFLFWRHLDWRQRLKVLVEADVLPASADKPVPQTMERLALEAAREHGKLAAVWEAMTPLLPIDKRQSNPFSKAQERRP